MKNRSQRSTTIVCYIVIAACALSALSRKDYKTSIVGLSLLLDSILMSIIKNTFARVLITIIAIVIAFAA